MPAITVPNSIGNVSFEDVVRFQTKILMGQQYEKRIIKANSEEDIIVACLRVAWNDAFRHVSQNTEKEPKDILINHAKIGKKKQDFSSVLGTVKNAEWDEILSEYICQKILYPNGDIYNWFFNFAKAHNSSDKANVIYDGINNKGLHNNFSSVKIINGTHPICFGHIQKLFNMALKTYLCLYMCKDILGIFSKMGNIINENYMSNADCPIDNVILTTLEDAIISFPSISTRLNKIKQVLKIKKFTDIKWSKIDNKSVYVNLQDAVSIVKPNTLGYTTNSSNLWYDFKVW